MCGRREGVWRRVCAGGRREVCGRREVQCGGMEDGGGRGRELYDHAEAQTASRYYLTHEI